MLFYGKTTGWIIVPLVAALLLGKKVEGFMFFIILMAAFGITCYGIYREIDQYKKDLVRPESDSDTRSEKINNGKQ